MPYTYSHPRPSVTTDTLVYSVRDGQLQVLLIERKGDPFRGYWALPGGFVRLDEDLEESARRELFEETALQGIPLSQFRTYGAPDRDPRERVITVVYLALVPSDHLIVQGGTDASDAKWFPTDSLPSLAFDHYGIIRDGRAKLAEEAENSVGATARVAFSFLPAEFTLAEAQLVFEILRGEELDKRNFRKWIMANWNLTDLGRTQRGGRHRPAALFSLPSD